MPVFQEATFIKTLRCVTCKCAHTSLKHLSLNIRLTKVLKVAWYQLQLQEHTKKNRGVFGDATQITNKLNKNKSYLKGTDAWVLWAEPKPEFCDLLHKNNHFSDKSVHKYSSKFRKSSFSKFPMGDHCLNVRGLGKTITRVVHHEHICAQVKMMKKQMLKPDECMNVTLRRDS